MSLVIHCVTGVTVTGVTVTGDSLCHWCYCHWCYCHWWFIVSLVLLSLVLLSLVSPSLYITTVKISISALKYVTGDSLCHWYYCTVFSGVMVPGEVGILLIYAPFFFLTARQRMNDPCHTQWHVKLVCIFSSLQNGYSKSNICTLSLNFCCLRIIMKIIYIHRRGADFAINYLKESLFRIVREFWSLFETNKKIMILNHFREWGGQKCLI